MSDLFAVSIEEQIAEVKRELRIREQVYPREVARGGRLSQAKADQLMRVMRAVLTTLEKVQAGAT